MRPRSLAKRISRPGQPLGTFVPGVPDSGYYNDLTTVALHHGGPEAARGWLSHHVADRRLANPVSVAQLGLGAWQLRETDGVWLDVVRGASRWLADELDGDGRLAYLSPMPHTYELAPPWYSAMAQGEAVSLLVRGASSLGEPAFADAAALAARPLVDPRFGLSVETPEGPVLEEYPTTPPAHVLNGWVFALWGVYDASLAPGESQERDAATPAFDRGARALAGRLHEYDLAGGWSRYDVYPHRIVHVASPFYHRLHVAQLRAMAALRPDLTEFDEVATRWAAAADRTFTQSVAVCRKVAFRFLAPRRTRGVDRIRA